MAATTLCARRFPIPVDVAELQPSGSLRATFLVAPVHLVMVEGARFGVVLGLACRFNFVSAEFHWDIWLWLVFTILVLVFSHIVVENEVLDALLLLPLGLLLSLHGHSKVGV